MKLNTLSVFALFLIIAGVLGICGCAVTVQPTSEPVYRGFGHIKVIAATYGRNCGVPYGNATHHLAEICDGRAICEYVIDYRVIGDPAGGCAKDYFAEWQCGRDPERGTMSVSAEAGAGTRIVLRCPVR
jgi:hypothetical protein